jgi:hypothetical protein
MSATKSILLDQIVTLLDGVTTTGAGSSYALPSRPCALGIQFSVDVNAGNFTVAVEVSLDGTNFFAIKTMTQADLVSLVYFTTLTGPYAAKFIRANPSVNSVPHAITIQIVAKPYP